MKKKIILMFSGQGSQYHHMGKELYENHERFQYWMDHCDEIVHPLIGTSLTELLYRGPGKNIPFDNITYTNPALLSIQYSLALILLETGIQPDFLLGYSLGEITASVVSGALSLEDGLKLVVEKARLVQEKTPPVVMLSIIESQKIIDELPGYFQNCPVTGYNFENNFVVSGTPQSIQYLQEALNKKNYIYQPLPVKYGFHTEMIDTIEQDLKNLFQTLRLSSISIPIISSFKKETIQEINEDYLWNLVRRPVEFNKTIAWTLQKGNCLFIDAGPSGSLATFVKYILPSDSQSVPLQTINQFGKDLDSLAKLQSNLQQFKLF